MRDPLPWCPVIRILLPTLLFAACSNPPEAAAHAAPAQAAAIASVDDDADCNLATPLVPGIPGSPGHLVVSARNPNGDSELAVLMRRFVDDLRDARSLLEAGQPLPRLHPVHRTMRCAWPTRPEERNARFDAMAQTYLAAVRAFDAEPNRDHYNGLVAGCIACHSQACGGPLDFLAGMKW